METRAWGLIAFLLVPVAALSGACGEAFSVPAGGAGGALGGSGGVPSSSNDSSTGSPGGGGGATTSSSTASGSCNDKDQDGATDCDGDCDDDDDATYPGAPEICGDAKDNDCKNGPDDTCNGLGTFVSNAGKDSNPGTQAAPVLTIKQGIQNAKTIGNGVSVYVAAGHYPEDVVVLEGISIYGGHDPITWARDLATNDTAVLSQGPLGVFVDDKVTRKTEIDGFRLQGKDGQTTGGSNGYGAAITILGGTPTLRNNQINGPVEGPGTRSIGLVLQGPSNHANGALIEGNAIAGGSGTVSQPCDVSIGVLIESKSWPPPMPGPAVELKSNTIRSGLCKSSRALVSWANADGSLVQDNDIDTGTATSGDAWGMIVAGSELDAVMIIDKNRINLAQSVIGGCPLVAATGTWCGGIDSQGSKSMITNNVVLGVKATRSTAVWLRNPELSPQSVALNSNFLDGAGTQAATGSQSAAVVLTVNVGSNTTVGRIRNNILFGGNGQSRFGIYEDSPLTKTCKPEKLANNDIFFRNPVGSDVLYRSWDGAVQTKVSTIASVNMLPFASGNMNLDPLIDATYHLASGSPCIDKGAPEEAPPVDFDGQPRPAGMNDVGADER